ncbi:hypothetical protein [Nostoc sp.]|uniref:hypothetical protein n=1 Tax=Nostoc sp. TaxID=1180 RepID=UPI002FF92D82
MTQKVLSIKVEPSDFTQFKEFAKGYKTQAEAFKALMQLTSIPKYASETHSQCGGIPNVCVLVIGTKLPLVYEEKPFKMETISMGYKRHKRDWYVYKEDRVVAIWNKSANGSQKWLEVAAQFPEEVWLAATKHRNFALEPLTTLRTHQAMYDRIPQFDSQPIIVEAIAKGWSYDWVNLKHSEDILTNEAEKYLNNLPITEVKQDSAVDTELEPANHPEVANPVQQVISKANLAARLTAKWVANSGAKTDETKAKVSTTLSDTLMTKSVNKCPIWTAKFDPEGLSWQPTNATREQWLSCGK